MSVIFIVMDIQNKRTLLSPFSKDELDTRVRLNHDQIIKTAKLISKLSTESPFSFIASSLPPENHPLTVDFFFVTTLQQFSFWSIKNGRYHLPLYDTIDGETLKGAFYLFKAYLKKIDTDPDFFSPQRQAEQSLDETADLFRSDNGNDVMPVIELHLDAAHRYGQSMLKLRWTPTSILQTSLQTKTPLETFLKMLDKVGGYCEDPLRKKSALLAMILNNRPEVFLPFGKDESLPPIIDYHCMRSCLRMGLIDVIDPKLLHHLQNRDVISEADEWAVRIAAFHAVELLPELSNRSMATVDQYFFFGRKRCPEMSEPECLKCSANSVCAKRKELFQPVIRTDYY